MLGTETSVVALGLPTNCPLVSALVCPAIGCLLCVLSWNVSSCLGFFCGREEVLFDSVRVQVLPRGWDDCRRLLSLLFWSSIKHCVRERKDFRIASSVKSYVNITDTSLSIIITM